jgi:hypothetical protein
MQIINKIYINTNPLNNILNENKFKYIFLLILKILLVEEMKEMYFQPRKEGGGILNSVLIKIMQSTIPK